MTKDLHAPKFYGRRKSKPLRVTKQSAFDDILPSVSIVPTADNIDPLSFFPAGYDTVWLEIGFGAGEHLLYQAEQNPHIAMIGCEPFINGLAAICQGIREREIKNIRILPDDARPFLKRLKTESIDRCFLLNSDPWPKKRHHKRRFIQDDTLDDLYRILKPGAPFRMSTDHGSLAVWQLGKTYMHGGFSWMADDSKDWLTRPADLPETRYQKKGVTHGRATVFLDFVRRHAGEDDPAT